MAPPLAAQTGSFPGAEDDGMSPAAHDIFRYLGLSSCSAAVGSFPMGELADMARAVMVDSHRQTRRAARAAEEDGGMQMETADDHMMDVAIPDAAYDEEALRVDQLRLQRLAASAPTGMPAMLGAEAPTAEMYWDNAIRYDDDDVAWSHRRVSEFEQVSMGGADLPNMGMAMGMGGGSAQGSPQRSQQGMVGRVRRTNSQGPMARRTSASDFFST